MRLSFKEEDIRECCDLMWEQATTITEEIADEAASGIYKLNRKYLSDLADEFKHLSLSEYQDRDYGALYTARRTHCGDECEEFAEHLDNEVYENILKEIVDTLNNCDVKDVDDGQCIKFEYTIIFDIFVTACNDAINNINKEDGNVVASALWRVVRDAIAIPLRKALDRVDEPKTSWNSAGYNSEAKEKINDITRHREGIVGKLKSCQYIDDRDIYNDFTELLKMKNNRKYQSDELQSMITAEIAKCSALLSTKEMDMLKNSEWDRMDIKGLWR